MSLSVAIDVTAAAVQRAGVGRYTRDLVYALAALSDGPALQPFCVAPKIEYPLAGLPAVTLRHRSIRGWRLEILARHIARLPAHGSWDGARVYHATDVVYPPIRSVPVVTTIHDMSYAIYPQYHTRLNGTYLRLITPLAVRRAALVIAVSDATKRDIVQRCGLPQERVRVVHTGVSPQFAMPPEPVAAAEARQRLDLGEPFLLSVGTMEPRKNLRGTLAAYRLLRERLPDAPRLVLVGGAGWNLDQERLLRPQDASSVRWLGYVSDDDLRVLYATCAAFIYPSFYEGWGLPVAEAMALGAPVVTSNVSSLPEVAGDAAVLVDPHHPEALAEGMQRVLCDGALAAHLRLAGADRARRFTTEAWARATLAVYREAAEG